MKEWRIVRQIITPALRLIDKTGIPFIIIVGIIVLLLLIWNAAKLSSKKDRIEEALFSKDWKWGEFVFDQKLRLNPKIKGINLYSKNKQFLSSETDWLDTFDFNVIDFEDIIF